MTSPSEIISQLQQHPSVVDIIDEKIDLVLQVNANPELNQNNLCQLFDQLDENTLLILSSYMKSSIDKLESAVVHLKGLQCILTERKHLLDTYLLKRETIIQHPEE